MVVIVLVVHAVERLGALVVRICCVICRCLGIHAGILPTSVPQQPLTNHEEAGTLGTCGMQPRTAGVTQFRVEDTFQPESVETLSRSPEPCEPAKPDPKHRA